MANETPGKTPHRFRALKERHWRYVIRPAKRTVGYCSSRAIRRSAVALRLPTYFVSLTTDCILIFTHIFLTSVVLVLNEMVLVLVIDSLVATEHEHEHRHPTEHEHEITNKSGESRRSRTGNVGKDEDCIRGYQMPLLRSSRHYVTSLQSAW
jgi:hypothetical protein